MINVQRIAHRLMFRNISVNTSGYHFVGQLSKEHLTLFRSNIFAAITRVFGFKGFAIMTNLITMNIAKHLSAAVAG